MGLREPHKPGGSDEHFQSQFPADFISEAIDQTRGWFYTPQLSRSARFDVRRGARQTGDMGTGEEGKIPSP